MNRRIENQTTFESTTTPEEYNLQLCARECARRLFAPAHMIGEANKDFEAEDALENVLIIDLC